MIKITVDNPIFNYGPDGSDPLNFTKIGKQNSPRLNSPNTSDNSKAYCCYTDKIDGKVLGPVNAPLFRLKKKYRIRLLIRGSKTLKLQNSLASIIPKFKFLSGIKLSVDVDPISFN